MTTQQIGREVDGAALANLLTERTGIRPLPARLEVAAGADLIRELGLILVTDPDARWLHSLDRAVSELTDARDRSGAPSRFRPPGPKDADGYPMGSHPALGAGNPVAPPIALSLDSDHRFLVGRVTFGPVFEGLPGSVFGGHIAAGFDAVLGVAASLTGGAVVARRITVEYHAPTPLNVAVEFLVPVPANGSPAEGSVVHVHGQVITGTGQVTAAGSAEFVPRKRSDFCAPAALDQATPRNLGGAS